MAAEAARGMLNAFSGERYIVAPSGSCAAMVKVFYPELLRDDPKALAEARNLDDRTYELSQFIVDVLGLPAHSQPKPLPSREKGLKVTYHEGCHLRRELGAVTQPRELIRSMPGVELAEMEHPDECCGFGGHVLGQVRGHLRRHARRQAGPDRGNRSGSGCGMRQQLPDADRWGPAKARGTSTSPAHRGTPRLTRCVRVSTAGATVP